MKKQKPKYIQIKEKIFDMIKEDNLQEGDKLPSEHALQEKFSSSRHTIRAALSELELEGIIYKEHGLGSFVANQKNNYKTIGVITTYLSEYIFPTIIRGIEYEITKSGHTLILASTDNDIALEEQALKMMMSRNVDAIIVEPTKSAYFNPNISLYLRLKKKGVPIMMLNAFYEEINFPYVILDDFAAGYKATQHLIQAGHKQIGGIFKIDDRQGKERLRGFIQACVDHEIKYSPEALFVFETENYREVLEKKVRTMIEKENKNFSGLVLYNDKVCLDVLRIIWSQGDSCPEDLSLVSHDNSNLTTVSETKVSSINHPKVEMGRYAAKEILQAIEDPSYEMKSKIYEATLCLRNSVKKMDL